MIPKNLIHYKNNSAGFVKTVRASGYFSINASQAAQNELGYGFPIPIFSTAADSTTVDTEVYTRRIRIIGIHLNVYFKTNGQTPIPDTTTSDVKVNMHLMSYLHATPQTYLSGLPFLNTRPDYLTNNTRKDVACSYVHPLHVEARRFCMEHAKLSGMMLNTPFYTTALVQKLGVCFFDKYIDFFTELELPDTITAGSTFTFVDVIGRVPLLYAVFSAMWERNAANVYKMNHNCNYDIVYYYQDVGDTTIY